MDPTLERCLRDLEERIDPAGERRLLQQWQGFCDGRFEGRLFTPSRREPSPPRVDWPQVPVNRALEDPEAMALQQFRQCSHQLQSAGGLLLCVRCNYGTGILPSLFGAEPFVMAEELDTLPTCRPLDGEEPIRRLVERGVPDLQTGLGGKVLDMGRRFARIAEQYPKIGRHVFIYHPDLQGPMDVLELLWGSEFFYALYDLPELVHELLELITQTYRAFMEAWREVISEPLPGHSAHWGYLHRGRIMLRDDSAMNLSPEMVREFVLPYDGRLLRELGGGGLHFCGRGDHYIELAGRVDGLQAVHMSQPEHNDLAAILEHTAGRGISLLGLGPEAAAEALRSGLETYGRVHCEGNVPNVVAVGGRQ